eukprot:TRINITY_DN1164_c0_g1_i1.p2 TRINITY_DN1164_c0_g1~~TRINITY_DN1164_c0_g1_i1.p2  ORF type:complete len:125 (+),score=61.87 TRINITY_DN1164_c0_g1_i1:56-376(+)
MSDSEHSGSSDGEGVETRGKMVQRHKRELRELKTKSDAALRSVPAKDKKKKQELQEQLKKTEENMLKKHKEELSVFEKEAEEKLRQLQLEESAAKKEKAEKNCRQL